MSHPVLTLNYILHAVGSDKNSHISHESRKSIISLILLTFIPPTPREHFIRERQLLEECQVLKLNLLAGNYLGSACQ